ncbi:MAG: HlyD family secretion protein [Deltaproteobacteria bacterium]
MKKMYLCIIMAAFVATGCTLNSNKLILKGDIQNNIISAVSTVPGKIVQMNKQLGEPVKKGDVIAVIDPANQKYAVDQLQAVVNMKKAKLEELQAGARPQQIQQAQALVRTAKAQLDLLNAGNRIEQIEQAKSAVSIAQEALSAAQITYEHTNTQYKNYSELYTEGALSKNDLDNAKLKLDTTAKQLSSAKAALESAKQQLALLKNGSTSQAISAAKANYDSANAQLKLLQSGATKQSIKAAQADLDQSAAQLNQAKNTLNSCNIIALDNGIIISKNYELGDVVNVGSNIADIAVSGDLYVLCYIPDQYLDKIYYNQILNVKTPTGMQEGRVSYIALKNEYTPKDKQSTSDSKHIATKIKIFIKDNKGILKSGITANVEVPLK